MIDSYAVIGNPISQSKSPLIHSIFAQQTNQSMHYTAILAPLDGFRAIVANFRRQGGKGLNVTMPFKLEAFEVAISHLTQRAAIAQAVNTIIFEDEEIFGDNTDGVGLVRDIKYNMGIPITKKRILVMGAGGAARGIILPLLQEEPSLLAIANRTLVKAEALQQQFTTNGNIVAGEFMSFADEHFDLIINATSASLQDALPELPSKIFIRAALAYDIMYGRESTPFLRFAQQSGARHVTDGIGMLVEQAAESFFSWRGIRPQTEPVIAMLKLINP